MSEPAKDIDIIILCVVVTTAMAINFALVNSNLKTIIELLQP